VWCHRTTPLRQLPSRHLPGEVWMSWTDRGSAHLDRVCWPEKHPGRHQERCETTKVADMADTAEGEAPPLTVVQPGEGRVGELGTIGVQFKLWGEDTGGAVSIVEHPFGVGVLVPPHLHTREDEYSIVTAGEIGFRSGDREVVLGAGGYITKPRGEVHAMWNAGAVPARMIEVISPAGFEHFLREVADRVAAGSVQLDDLAAIAKGYGLQFAEPEWLPDVIARYGLTPPPAT
jgi:mannose-6-phosphate isomerase-like protein (cupin superfamily)